MQLHRKLRGVGKRVDEEAWVSLFSTCFDVILIGIGLQKQFGGLHSDTRPARTASLSLIAAADPLWKPRSVLLSWAQVSLPIRTVTLT